MGTLPDGVRADAVQMPGTGAQPRRAEEVSLQEQADEPGWKHHRFVGEHVRLGKISADEGGGQTAPAAGPRWLPAVVRGCDRRQDKRDQGGAHAAVRSGDDPGNRPRLQRLRVVSGTDAGGSVLRDADERQGGLRGEGRVASSAKQQRGARPDHLLSPVEAGGRGSRAVPAGRDMGRGETGGHRIPLQPAGLRRDHDCGHLQGPLAGGIVFRELDMVHSFGCHGISRINGAESTVGGVAGWFRSATHRSTSALRSIQGAPTQACVAGNCFNRINRKTVVGVTPSAAAPSLTDISPPMHSTNLLVSARPMPWPSICPNSAPKRLNGWNSNSIFSGAMPMPVSATIILSLPFGRSSTDTVTCPPGLLYLMALDNRLMSTCLRRTSSN